MDLDKDVGKLREDFPILEKMHYFNTCASGPAFKRVRDTVYDYWDQRMMGLRVPGLNTREQAARLLHAGEDEIAWTCRASDTLHIIQSMMDLRKGENIVVTDLGYPTTVYGWMPFREQGVELRRIKNKNGMIWTGDFEKAIDDNTRVVSISHTEWTTGTTYDLKAISEIAHEHNAVVAIDAYQSMGAVDIDAPKTGVDFLFSGAGKWLCCHTGAGIFYVRRDIIDDYDPDYRYFYNVTEAFQDGGAWAREDHDNIVDYEGALVGDARKFERGTVSKSAAALHGLYASLEYFNELGMKNVETRVKKLSGILIDGLIDIGVHVNTSADPDRRAGVVTYHTGSHMLNQKSLESLKKDKVSVSLRYAGGIGGIRTSTHFYNTEKDIEALLVAQKKLL